MPEQMPWEKYAAKAPADGPWTKYAQPPATTPQPIATQGTLSAAKPEGWFEQAEEDLKQGGTRTVVGRGLGMLQGRGDKGYTGTESGVSKGAADIAGSPAVGALHVAQGISETLHGHPLKGAATQAKGYLEASTLPSMLMGGPEAKAAVEAVPSKSAAGDLFKIVMQDARNVPVQLTRSGNEIMRMSELTEHGGKSVPQVNKLIARFTNPEKPPMTYRMARDFYSHITKMASEDYKALSGDQKRQIAIIASTLKQDIGDAAAAVGRESEYYAGLKEYAKAAKLQATARRMAKWGAGAAAASAGLGGAYEAVKHFGILPGLAQ